MHTHTSTHTLSLTYTTHTQPSKRGIENLFLTVLVATPVGHYFTAFLQTLQTADAATVSGEQVGSAKGNDCG